MHPIAVLLKQNANCKHHLILPQLTRYLSIFMILSSKRITFCRVTLKVLSCVSHLPMDGTCLKTRIFHKYVDLTRHVHCWHRNNYNEKFNILFHVKLHIITALTKAKKKAEHKKTFNTKTKEKKIYIYNSL